MNTAQTAGLALIIVILLKIAVYMIRFYNREKRSFQQPTIILVVGAHSSTKSQLNRDLQARMANSTRCFIRASSNELIERIPSGVVPRSDMSISDDAGDSLFDAWTCSEQPDGSVDVRLTALGSRVMLGLHKAWMEIVRAGNNLIIDYTMFDPIFLKHLLSQLKSVLGRNLDRLIFIEYQSSLTLLQESERENPSNPFPIGFALSSFKKQKELSQLSLGYGHRMVLRESEKSIQLCDTAYRFISKSGLL